MLLGLQSFMQKTMTPVKSSLVKPRAFLSFTPLEYIEKMFTIFDWIISRVWQTSYWILVTCGHYVLACGIATPQEVIKDGFSPVVEFYLIFVSLVHGTWNQSLS